MEKESLQKMEVIEDTIHKAKHITKAEAEYYHLKKQAEANKLLLTKEYLELKKYEALSNNNKVYFGSDIPSMFLQAGVGVAPPAPGVQIQWWGFVLSRFLLVIDLTLCILWVVLKNVEVDFTPFKTVLCLEIKVIIRSF